MIHLEKILTETRNPASLDIDKVSTLALVKIINDEDKKVAFAVEKAATAIAAAIDCIADRLKKGGRLFYIGAGTSGRLGVLDAAECPPTYGTSPELVQGIIAGGTAAMFKAKEGAEDSAALASSDLARENITAHDVIVGLAASGRTPYAIGGLQYAASIGAATISIDCTPDSPLASAAQIPITAAVGPEVITGSTRMKAGSAQKMILNMLSTGAMIKLGKVYGNLMVDVKASNKKLEERACRIVMAAAGVNRETATAALLATKGQAKLAIFMLLGNLDLSTASKLLTSHQGFISKALQQCPSQPAKSRQVQP